MLSLLMSCTICTSYDGAKAEFVSVGGSSTAVLDSYSLHLVQRPISKT